MGKINFVDFQKISESSQNNLVKSVIENINGSTLDISALVFIDNLISHIKPQCIFEFGSGLSTRIFDEYLSKNPAKLMTVDNVEFFLDQTTKNLKNADSIVKVFIFVLLRICPRQIFHYR